MSTYQILIVQFHSYLSGIGNNICAYCWPVEIANDLPRWVTIGEAFCTAITSKGVLASTLEVQPLTIEGQTVGITRTIALASIWKIRATFSPLLHALQMHA